MKRYLLFAWCKDLINEEDPRGGWNDYVGEGDTIEEIVEASSYYRGLYSVFTDEENYCQIVDTLTLKKFEHQYGINWSEEDNEWVATCSKYPSLSHLAKTQKDALIGIIGLVIEEDTNG